MLPVVEVRPTEPSLQIDPALTARWLEAFLRDEMQERRGTSRAVIGLSGGVDSALVAYCARGALGPENGLRDPHAVSHLESVVARRCAAGDRALGIHGENDPISDAVDGYLSHAPDADPRAQGQRDGPHADAGALRPVGAARRASGRHGKQDRTSAWAISLGMPTTRRRSTRSADLFKTQVWTLAQWLGVPHEVVDKPPSADLEANQNR